jgi:hypothetical protein
MREQNGPPEEEKRSIFEIIASAIHQAINGGTSSPEAYQDRRLWKAGNNWKKGSWDNYRDRTTRELEKHGLSREEAEKRFDEATGKHINIIDKS